MKKYALSMRTEEINVSVCADDESNIFKDRAEIIAGSRTSKQVIEKYELLTHAGSSNK